MRDLRRALAHYASPGFEVTPYAGGDYYGFADRVRFGSPMPSQPVLAVTPILPRIADAETDRNGS